MSTSVRPPRARPFLALALLALLLASAVARAPGARAGLGWSPAGALATPCAYATATLLPDGRVLVAGGLKGGPYSNSDTAELYDVATNSWRPAGTLTAPRAHHTATLLPDGDVLVVGGAKPVCCGGMTNVERYDAATNRWTPAAPLASPRLYHTATLLNDGRVLVTGGLIQSGGPSTPATILDTAELYDPVGDRWSPAAPMTQPRVQHTATRLPDGTILVAAGAGPEDKTVATAERYDPATNRWRPAAALATARRAHTATPLHDGTVLVAGGAVSGAAERFDPRADAWTSAGTMPTPAAGYAATLLTGGEVLLTGGITTGGVIATARRYSPATNAWTTDSSLTAARVNHVAALVNGQVLVAGGSAQGTPLATAERYDDAPAGTCFVETGRCVRGPFLRYWREHGGLALNGYPLSEEFAEQLEDGQVYRVQYFERVRLEYHPENPAPYDVLLGQFGRRLHPADPPAAPLPSARYFPETGHNLGGSFRPYWEAHGGLAQFGYPLSEEIEERLEDGRVYTVQYFERARFERHPENPPPYDILLGQFGRRILAETAGR